MKIFTGLLILLSFIKGGTSYKRNEELEAAKSESLIATRNNYEISCNQSDTCTRNVTDQTHLVNYNLENRNCMCDEQCVLYEDCCKDSKFQVNSSTRQNKFTCVSTATNGFIYMIVSCPTTWNGSEDVRENCETTNDLLYTLDVWILVPVTDHQFGIVYKNMFCAICNDVYDFEFWKIGFSCINKNGSQELEMENLLDPNEVLDKMQPNGTYSGFWQSKVENTTYHCSWHGKMTNDTHLRYCVPPEITNCSLLSSTNCSDYYTSDGHTDFEASTNDESNFLSTLYGCHYPKQFIQSPYTVDISNPYIIKVFRCHQIPQESAVYHKICVKPESKSNEIESNCFNEKCLIDGFFLKNVSVTFLNNETIFLKDRGISFPDSEWMELPETGLIYICGKHIPQTRFQTIVFILDDWLSEILIKFSIICLLLHLLVFQQLPEMKNFSGRNLALFSATLLVAFLCYEIGPQLLPNCQITAVILHYSLLSYFTWSLIMSYDCWHTLRVATKQLRNVGKERKIRFFIYCSISWLIPACIVSVALFFELSPSNVIPCEKKLGYGKYNQCFIGQGYGLITFFVLPASSIFLCNICFFIHTFFIIYCNRGSSINPNTRNDFLMYTRLGLMMGLTWTMGTILYFTQSELVGLLFSILNMSQGILIFFAFTFKQKTLKDLLEKHQENTKVARVLQFFIHDTESEAPTQMTQVPSSNN